LLQFSILSFSFLSKTRHIMALTTKNINSAGLTPQQLAQYILGDSGTVIGTTVKYTGNNLGAGIFGGGISDGLNIEAGITFSTGDIGNTDVGMSTSFGSPGDAGLSEILFKNGSASTTTNDAAVLEFDFIPKQGPFSLEYVFASEEYNDFVGSGFNDVFGFYLNNIFISVIPGDSSQIVSINNINNGKNSALYVDNTNSTFKTTWNGFTKVLSTPQAFALPNVANRLKLAIADTSDTILDSAVFIYAPPVVNFSQPNYQVKEDGTVVGANITINRSGITLGKSSVDVKFSNGSATGGAALGDGIDFVFTTQTINFEANQTTASLTVPINNDYLVEPTENLTLSFANPTNAKIGIIQNTANLDIIDNDTAGITITSTGSSTAVTEGGITDTYTVVLNSKPANLAILTVKPDAQTDLGAGGGNSIALNFTPVNWSSPQTVNVTAVDDAVVETSPHTSTIIHTASSADPNYDGNTPPMKVDGIATTALTVNITDNDTPQVKITETGDTTKIGEGGNSDTYTAVLTTQPIANVTVTVSPDTQSDVGAGGGNPVTLNFTPSNWNVPQIVTVQAVDDVLVEANPHATTITHKASSTDTKYNLITIPSVTAQITDNDSAGVTITPTSTTATEGGATGSYKVGLTSKPTAPVKINFNTGSQIDSISTFTFTSDNWNLPQIVTVKATDDSIVEGTHTGTINHSIVAGSAAEYESVTIAPVSVSITDNDTTNPITPSVKIAPVSTNAAEGGVAGSYTVALNTQPTAPVTVNFTTGSQIDAIAPITFTPANWNVAQTVTVKATDDTVVEGEHTGTINHSIAAGSAAEYLPVAIAPVAVTIADNDTTTSPVGAIVTPVSTTATEGGVTGSYSIVLKSQPTAPVNVGFATDSQIDAIASFTFTVDNWNVPKTFTVTATDDNIVEGGHLSTITPSSTSTDLTYNGIGISKVDVLILDNDTPSVVITPTNTNAAEGGATGSYSVVLTKTPTANVTVNFATGSQIDAIAPITFTPANWNVPKTVTVTATTDTIVEGTHNGIISHNIDASSAVEYLPVAIAPVAVTIADNNTATSPAGVTITQIGGSTIVAEGGTTDTFQVALNSQPNTDVTISFATGTQIDAIGLFTFTPANWNAPQTATVKATDDNIVEGTHLTTITASASSTDLTYNQIGIPKVDVLILDNDTPNIAINPSSINVAEGGANGSYSVVLTKAPTANVTVNFATGSQLDAIDPITFTPVSWNQPQTLTVKAIDDNLVEGTHSGLILASVAAGSAAEYLPVAIAPISVSIADNDIAPEPKPVIIPEPKPVIIPEPTPVIITEPTPATIPPLPPPEDPDCICQQITLPSISPSQGFNTVENNIVGTETNDFLIGTNGNDGINGLAGDDVLIGLAGRDNLIGGLMSNVPVGPQIDRDLLFGGPGEDYLSGQAGNDTLLGGKGSDATFGGKDNDLIWGGRSSDTILGEEGNDSLYGGTNNESDRDRIGNDLLFGSQGNDLLNGQDGEDTLSGGSGNDTMHGGKSNDLAVGDLGNDLIFGDRGTDTLCGGEGADTIYGDIGSPIPVGATAGQDLICGCAGNDLLFGNEGNDTINGGTGDDTVIGGKDNDSLIGSAGDDVLIGEEGSDTMLGGSGFDRFVLTPGQGSDVISDFRKGEDLLSLTGGLTFAQLSISQGNGGTLIRIASSGEVLAILNGVQTSAIVQSDFINLS
jgi:Ca2+-binding RTX toxin-like protein